jgi:hypothetical protein
MFFNRNQQIWLRFQGSERPQISNFFPGTSRHLCSLAPQFKNDTMTPRNSGDSSIKVTSTAFNVHYEIYMIDHAKWKVTAYSWFHITFPRMLRTSFRTSLWSSKVHTEIHKPICKQSLWLVP